jgi:hypothetical protein
MRLHGKALIALVFFGLMAVAGTVTGLGFTGGFSSDKSSTTDSNLLSPAPSVVVEPTPTPFPVETREITPASPEAPAESAPVFTPEETKESLTRVLVEPDSDFEEELRDAGLSIRGWKTDFSRHSVPFAEIFSGGPPRDGIPPLDDPKFTTPDEAAEWLGDQEPVISFELNGETRAYPLQILMWHEIANDVVGGVPVTVTFCPLCNTALVFERTLDGVVYDFGTSGNLRNSDLVMWDRQTESWWQQFTGEAIVGELTGRKLKALPAPIISFADFKDAHSNGAILSRDTGFSRAYGRNPYGGYDRADNPPFLFFGDLDGRLAPKDRVVDVIIDDIAVAFPFKVLGEERAVDYTVGTQDVAVFFKSGTVSALDGSSIASSKDVGATGVFDPNVDGKRLTFRADGDWFVDEETGSTWNILGQAVDGPLKGQQLKPIVHTNVFWFAIAAFRPDAMIYQGQG